MKKQKVWMSISIDTDYIFYEGEYVTAKELYVFTPEQLVEKLKEAWNAGYNSYMAEFNPSTHAPGEGEFINNQNIEL